MRQRAYYIETRYRFDGVDVDLKYMPVSWLTSVATQSPNLDDLYLEKLHAIYQYRTVGADDELTAILSWAREQRKATLSQLCRYAHETYGKLVYSAVKQGVFRDEHVAAQECVAAAQRTLIRLAYLQNGICPPPYKWCVSASRLSALPAGDTIMSLLSKAAGGPSELIDRLALLYDLEEVVAGDRASEPWSSCRGDRWWWWKDYRPTPTRRPEESAT